MKKRNRWGASLALLVFTLSMLPAGCRGSERAERMRARAAAAARQDSLREAARRPATAAPGSELTLMLNQTLSPQTHRIGDPFTATVRTALTGEEGGVVLPEGAVVRGRITQASPPASPGEAGLLRLAFESVSVGGKTLAVDAVVLRAEPVRRAAAGQGGPADSAAAGAEPAGARVVERETGAEDGPTGTVIVFTGGSADMMLPAGSELAIRLESPLRVREQR